MTSRSAPIPELTRWQSIIGIILSLAIPGAGFAAAWGNINARMNALERRIEQTVTRTEQQADSRRLDELVTEVRGLRSDLLAIVKERR